MGQCACAKLRGGCEGAARGPGGSGETGWVRGAGENLGGGGGGGARGAGGGGNAKGRRGDVSHSPLRASRAQGASADTSEPREGFCIRR